jgi:hypothetical protein
MLRRDSGPVVTWRRAQMVLLSAQGMDVAAIAKVAFTSEDRVRDVIRGGALPLTQTMRATGLDRGVVTALERWRAPRAVHDPGKIIADLVVTLALGGDCLADIAVLRAQPELAGPARRNE